MGAIQTEHCNLEWSLNQAKQAHQTSLSQRYAREVNRLRSLLPKVALVIEIELMVDRRHGLILARSPFI